MFSIVVTVDSDDAQVRRELERALPDVADLVRRRLAVRPDVHVE